jgi:hypothetical protein
VPRARAGAPGRLAGARPAAPQTAAPLVTRTAVVSTRAGDSGRWEAGAWHRISPGTGRRPTTSSTGSRWPTCTATPPCTTTSTAASSGRRGAIRDNGRATQPARITKRVGGPRQTRSQLTSHVTPGAYTFARDMRSLSRRRPRRHLHNGLDLSSPMFAPCLLGCPGTPRHHSVSAARRGCGRPDKMAAPGTC